MIWYIWYDDQSNKSPGLPHSSFFGWRMAHLTAKKTLARCLQDSAHMLLQLAHSKKWLIWADSKSPHGLLVCFFKTWWRFTHEIMKCFSMFFTEKPISQNGFVLRFDFMDVDCLPWVTPSNYTSSNNRLVQRKIGMFWKQLCLLEANGPFSTEPWLKGYTFSK